MDIDRIFAERRVVVACGAGGVGKTTSAAAIACRAAQTGRRTAVLTIDPARRLAASLGIGRFTGEAQEVAVPPGEEGRPGRLDVLMLDTRSTYDRMVQRYATTSGQAEAILKNPFYRHFSGAVGGSHEFTAMERLHELIEANRYDLIVLDTPPTIHALDFLDAPQRLIDAFDESIFRWIIRPYLMAGKVGVQVLSFGSAYIFKTLAKFAGGEMMEHLSEFLQLFQGMFEGFRERARAVQTLLHDPSTRFFIVATPQANALQEAVLFHRELARMDLPFGGFLLNRALVPLEKPLGKEALTSRLAALPEAHFALSAAFIDRLADAEAKHQAAARSHRRAIDAFLGPIEPPPPLYVVPLFDNDIADVRGLVAFAALLRQSAVR
ncbi:MAG: ArsA family ATPase [Myxococcales bacterium]|nr:MAG: ArsA family ATPase [Myxococcales bacterium]